MTRKLVVFNDHSWIKPQLRSRKRPVLGNAALAHQALCSVNDSNIRQISFLQSDAALTAPITQAANRIFGTGVRREMLAAYRFLVHNYMPGDEIYLIGAGRGGYTMQCLAELISISGLLQLESFGALSHAYTYSRLTEKARNGLSGRELRAKFSSRDVPIRFLGCWDPVGLQGAPTPFLRHATRLWSEFNRQVIPKNAQSVFQAFALDEFSSNYPPNLLQGAHSANRQEIEQVWFTGKHSNVTGGQRDSRLSDIALRWLVGKAMMCDLKFDADKIEDLTTPDPLGCVAIETRTDRLFSFLNRRSSARLVGRADASFSREQMPGTEKIHVSVKQRQEKDPQYKPVALNALPPGTLPDSYEEDLPRLSERKHERQQVNGPATLLVNSRRINGNMLDISEGGACVWAPLDLPVGTSVTVRSSLLFGEEKKGRVAWIKNQSLGLEFSGEIDLEKHHPGEGHTLQ